MIYSLSGELKQKNGRVVIVGAGHFDFSVIVPISNATQLLKTGDNVKFFTFLHVREGGIDLYGFLTKTELEFFEALISVSGIGPKSAISILSVAPIEQLMAAVSGGEVELLRKSSGVGKKTAERIVLELKDKVALSGEDETIERMHLDNDVLEALVSLGYPRSRAKDAMKHIDPATTNTSDRLKEALKNIRER